MAALLSTNGHDRETSALLSDEVHAGDSNQQSTTVDVPSFVCRRERLDGPWKMPRRCACLPRLSRARWISILMSSAVFFVLIGVAYLLIQDALAKELYTQKFCYSQYSGAARIIDSPLLSLPVLLPTFNLFRVWDVVEPCTQL